MKPLKRVLEYFVIFFTKNKAKEPEYNSGYYQEPEIINYDGEPDNRYSICDDEGNPLGKISYRRVKED